MKLARLLSAGVAAVGLLAGAVPAMAADGATVTPSIVGGVTATQDYPFSGSLQLDNHGDPNWGTCGVTLINASFAETNAHCVTNEPTEGVAAVKAQHFFSNWVPNNTVTPAIDRTDPSIYHIRFGSNDRLNGGVVRHVKKITVHPGWNWGVLDAKGEFADIAILELDKPVTTIKPAVIAPVDRSQTVREIGWGLVDENPPPPPVPSQQFQRQIDVGVADDAACADAGIAKGELCLGGTGGGTCNGDSGSPALQNTGVGPEWSHVIGSNSRAAYDTCGDVGEPDVDTDLYYYIDWIISVEYGYNDTGASAHQHTS